MRCRVIARALAEVRSDFVNLPNDPYMLFSIVNMKLRDENLTLNEFCEEYDVDKSSIVNALQDIGFTYDENLRRFK